MHGNIVYAGTDITPSMLAARFWISDDRGVSWEPASNGLTFGGLRAIVADPYTADSPETTHIYAAGYGRVSGQEAYIGKIERNPVVFKSTDGGNSWSESAEGIDWTELDQSVFSAQHSRPLMRSLVLDPSSGAGSEGALQTLCVAGNGFVTREDGEFAVKVHRIYKSIDAGASWFAADSGLPVFPPASVNPFVDAQQVIPISIDPINPQTLYVGTFLDIDTRTRPQNPFEVAIANGVFKSTDGGANWFHSSEGLPRHDESDVDSSHWDVFALAVAPSDPEVLYVAVSPLFDWRSVFDEDYDGRRGSKIFKSLDAGASWVEANVGIPPDADIRGLTVDPEDADVVYANNRPSNEHPGLIFRTTDGGALWAVYDTGISAQFANSLVIGHDDGHQMLFIGTGGGVFGRQQ